jgi:hypothetical protein
MEDITLDANALTFAAVVLPPVISLINQKGWGKEVRGLVALGVCIVYSLLVVVLRQDVDWTQWRDLVLQVLAGAFGAYKLFWGPTNIGPDIEERTSIGRHSKEAQGGEADESSTPEV